MESPTKANNVWHGSRDQTFYQILTVNPVKLPEISSGKNTLSFNFLMEEAEAGSWKLVLQWGGSQDGPKVSVINGLN